MYHFQIEDFVGNFPLWVLVKNAKPRDTEGGLQLNEVLTGDVGNVRAIAVFTDQDRARQCARRLRLPEKSSVAALQISCADDMIQFLTGWNTNTQHVAFDPDPVAGRAKTPFSITTTIEALRRCVA